MKTFLQIFYDFNLACSLAARINLDIIKECYEKENTVKEIVENRFFGGMGLEGDLRNLVVFLDRLRDIVVGRA